MGTRKYVLEVDDRLFNSFGEWDQLCVPVFMQNGENSYTPCGYKHLRLLTKEDLADLPDNKWSHLDRAGVV